MKKHFITAQTLITDAFTLANKVYEDGFRPTFIIGIWRGGAPIAIAVQEYFEFKKLKTDHISVRTSSYYGINKQHKKVQVHGLDYIVENTHSEDSILIVDDVFDSGKSVAALIKEISVLKQNDTPKEIRIACPWYKPKNNVVNIVPHYYLYTSTDWLVFPHELVGLSIKDITDSKSDLAHIRHLFE